MKAKGQPRERREMAILRLRWRWRRRRKYKRRRKRRCRCRFRGAQVRKSQVAVRRAQSAVRRPRWLAGEQVWLARWVRQVFLGPSKAKEKGVVAQQFRSLELEPPGMKNEPKARGIQPTITRAFHPKCPLPCPQVPPSP